MLGYDILILMVNIFLTLAALVLPAEKPYQRQKLLYFDERLLKQTIFFL